jgi:hypothetical protein
MVRHAAPASHPANGHEAPTLVGVISGYRQVAVESSARAG